MDLSPSPVPTLTLQPLDQPRLSCQHHVFAQPQLPLAVAPKGPHGAALAQREGMEVA